MKLIIFTEDQKNAIVAEYATLYRTDYLEPIEVFRSKYLAGFPVPFTEIKEYGLPLDILENHKLAIYRGFLKMFPVYDANYYRKEKDINTGEESIVYY